jgi:hypothetical protein
LIPDVLFMIDFTSEEPFTERFNGLAEGLVWEKVDVLMELLEVNGIDNDGIDGLQRAEWDNKGDIWCSEEAGM